MKKYPSIQSSFRHHPGTDTLIRCVETTINTHEMFQKGDAILVGVSGGPDSVALIDILVTLAPKYALKLGVAHMNHSLRPEEAETDAKFSASLARKFNLPFFTTQVDVHQYRKANKLSLEEAARHTRYTFLNTVADEKGYKKIAIGHHSDDNAESILMFLFRGCGLQGLSGIPPIRENRIIRPLIQSTREEIIEYLDTRALPYVTDSSNTNIYYIRNRIRRYLIPELESYNPNITQTLNRLANIVSAENEWMDGMATAVFQKAILSMTSNQVSLTILKFKNLHVAVQRRLIRKAIGSIKGDLRRISYVNVEAGIDLLNRGRPGSHINLPGGIVLSVTDKVLVLSKEKSGQLHRRFTSQTMPSIIYNYDISAEESTYIKEIHAHLQCNLLDIADLPDFDTLGKHVAFIDGDLLSFPLVIRNILPGDRFRPLGMAGTQKVKKYFINHKVKQTDRQFYPVLLNKNNIIWVVGHRIDDSVRIKSSTRKVLKVEFFLPKL